MLLYLARHGQSEANVQRIFANTGQKYGLTDLGRSQAEQLAERMAVRPIQAIFSSPILRAVQTAEIVSKRIRVPVEIQPALREFDVGEWEGKTDPRGWQEHRNTMQAWLVENRLDARMQGGESWHDIEARFIPFVDRLVQSASLHSAYLLIGHGGTFLSMLPRLTRDITPQQAFETSYPNTAIITLEWQGNAFHLISME